MSFVPSSSSISMSLAAVASRIEEDYANSTPYQYGLEAVRNALQQPGTTWVSVAIVQWNGALKRGVVNSGSWMSEDTMSEYFSTIGEGDGEMWRLDNTLGNRHAGFRSATLPFTDVVVISWHETEQPDGRMITMFHDLTTHEYRHTAVTVPTPDELAVLTDQAEVVKTGSGFAVVLLGRDWAVDGPFCDPNPVKNETDGGIIDLLRDRMFITVNSSGDPVTVTAATLMPDTNSSTGGKRLTGHDGTQYRTDVRTIHGNSNWASDGTTTGTVAFTADGLSATATVSLKPAREKERHKKVGGGGFIEVRYKNETHILGGAGLHPDLAPVAKKFGMPLAEVFHRVGVTLEFPTGPGSDPAAPQVHVHQNPSRSHLIRSDGKELDVTKIGAAFIEVMPSFIIEANREAREALTTTSSLKISTGDRLKKRLAGRLKACALTRRRQPGSGLYGPVTTAGSDVSNSDIASPAHTPAGPPNPHGQPGRTPGGHKSGKKTKKRGATRPAKVTPISTRSTTVKGDAALDEVKAGAGQVPEPSPMKSSDWNAQFSEHHFASWDRAAGVVYFNLGHALLSDQYTHFNGPWMDQNPRFATKVTSEDVRTAVREAYFEDVIARVMHVASAHGDRAAADLLTDEVLTASAYGLENVEHKIVDSLRSASRRGVVKEVA